MLCCVCALRNYSKVQSSKETAEQKEGSASKLIEASANNPTEQVSNPEPAVSNSHNEDQPETDPSQATQSSNIQVSDLVEDEVVDSVKE